MAFDPEFKKALQMLSNKEKDALILRMLRTNLQLANRLHFELMQTDTVENKRDLVKKNIEKRIQLVSGRYYVAGYLLMYMRDLSGDINEHVYITKDKQGEILLNCYMLRCVLELNNERIVLDAEYKTYSLCIYIIARVFKIMMFLQKQHEDFHVDFREDIQGLGALIGNNDVLMKLSIRNGLDVNWLIQFNIPNDISEIYKELRKNGFLR